MRQILVFKCTSKCDIMGAGPLTHKPRCTSKCDIRGDPLLKKNMEYEQVGHKGDPLLINHGVRATGTIRGPFAKASGT